MLTELEDGTTIAYFDKEGDLVEADHPDAVMAYIHAPDGSFTIATKNSA